MNNGNPLIYTFICANYIQSSTTLCLYSIDINVERENSYFIVTDQLAHVH